jgi:hypothetical protein
MVGRVILYAEYRKCQQRADSPKRIPDGTASHKNPTGSAAAAPSGRHGGLPTIGEVLPPPYTASDRTARSTYPRLMRGGADPRVDLAEISNSSRKVSAVSGSVPTRGLGGDQVDGPRAYKPYRLGDCCPGCQTTVRPQAAKSLRAKLLLAPALGLSWVGPVRESTSLR